MTKKGAVVICGETFKTKRRHFSFEELYKVIDDMKELKKLMDFSELESISLNGTNINDIGLRYIAQCPTVTNINLTFTSISDQGIAHLSTLPNLEYLRLKETRIGPKSVAYFNTMTSLKSLQVHETALSGAAVEALNLPNLEELFIDADTPKDMDVLINVSKKMPACRIIIKGKGEFLNGVFTT